MTRPASFTDAADALEAQIEHGGVTPEGLCALVAQLRAWGAEYQPPARVLEFVRFPGQRRPRGRGPDGDAA